MHIFDNFHINFISLSSLIVTIFLFFQAMFLLAIKNKRPASKGLMVFFMTLTLFYFPYVSSALYNPAFAFHRWFTVTFVLMATVFITQFFFKFPENTHPRAAKVMYLFQFILNGVWSIYFCYATISVDKIYKFNGHQWDFAAETISKYTGLLIVVNILTGVFTAVWKGIVYKKARWALFAMSFSTAFATIVPGITNVLSRDGALDRGIHQTVINFAVIIGFFSFVMIYINTTKEKTTFMAKIIGISFATFLLMMAPISLLTLQDKEIAYDLIHTKDTSLVLQGEPQPKDLRYDLTYSISNQNFEFKNKKPEGLNITHLRKPEYINTYIYARIMELAKNPVSRSKQGFKDVFLQTLEGTNHPAFSGYKNLILKINDDLNDEQISPESNRVESVLNTLDEDFRKILTTYNKTRVMKDSNFRDAITKKMSSVDEKKLMYPFAVAILKHLESSKSQSAELKAEVLEYLVLMQKPGSRHYRRHKVPGQDPFIGFMQVDIAQAVVHEIGYSYLEYRAFIHHAAVKLFWILCAIVVVVLIGFRFFFSGALVTPLNGLLSGVTEVNEGNFDVHVPIKVEDEIGFLSRSFNGMVSSIKEAQKKLQDYAENLEEKVKERTKELKATLDNVQKLKDQQDGDYFLTSLLTRPLNENHYKGDTLEVNFLISQKKKFEFKNRKDEIGGDLCSAHRIQLKDRHYLVFMNADAMGKSIQGAGGVLVLGAVFESMIMRTQLSEAARDYYPERWLKNAFIELHKVFEAFEGSMLMSVVFGLVEENTGYLYYLNAEHPYPVYYHNNKAEFLDPDILFRKLGTIGLGEGVHILTKQLYKGDVFLSGSDGRDDILMGMTEDGERIINEDENIFLTTVEEANCDLDRINELLDATGELTDDLSLLKIEYTGDGAADDFELSKESKAIINESRALGKKSIWKGALSKLDSISDTDQNHHIIKKEKAVLLYKMKEYEKAIAIVRDYTDHHPGDVDMIYLASILYKRLRDLEQAADFGERVRMRQPNDADNLVNLADIYHHIGIKKRAIRMLDRALESDPQNRQGLRLKQQLGV